MSEIAAAYRDSLDELSEVAEVWLEAKAARKPNEQLATAIDQVTRESRKYERKLRKETRRADVRPVPAGVVSPVAPSSEACCGKCEGAHNHPCSTDDPAQLGGPTGESR